MGAPTVTHESRVEDLETLATLAAFTAPLALPWRLRPDVVRINAESRALFLGDAKATETPGCAATFARLRWYAAGLRTLASRIEWALVALAVEAGPCVPEWRRTILRAFAADAAATVMRTSTACFDDTAVVSVEFALPQK